MDKLLIIMGVIAVYFVIQLWVLPAFGVPTWMSGQCSPGEGEKKSGENTSENATAEKKQLAEPPVKAEKSEGQAP